MQFAPILAALCNASFDAGGLPPSEKHALVTARLKQEAQLPQRDSASATHVFLGSLTDRALY